MRACYAFLFQSEYIAIPRSIRSLAHNPKIEGMSRSLACFTRSLGAARRRLLRLRRAGARASSESRFESKGPDFHHKVRQGFLDLASSESDRFVVIDAARDVDAIADDIVSAVMPRLSAVGIS